MPESRKFTSFGKQVKCRLIDLEKTQQWLQEEVQKKTDLFVDSSYFYKIFTGQRTAPRVVQAICEILDITDAPTS